MVAITVILAAVIGAFVLGFGGGTSAAPSASWSWSGGELVDDGDDQITLEHDGGDPVVADRLTIQIGDTGAEVGGVNAFDVSSGDELTAGDSVTFATDSTDSDELVVGTTTVSSWSSAPSGEVEVQLVWESEDGESSSVISSEEVDFSGY